MWTEGFKAINNARDKSIKGDHQFYKSTCVVCGKEFWPVGPAKLVCSDDCRKVRVKELAAKRRKAEKELIKAAQIG